MTDRIKVLLMFALWSGCLGAAASDANGLTACTGVAEIKSKSRPLYSGETLMVSLLTLEKQGEADSSD